jgi:high-affinity iron transporter
MVTNYLIGLREGLEAALVVGVLVAYLVRTQKRDLLPAAAWGISVAVGISLAVGATLTYGQRQLPSNTLEVVEGVLGIAAAVLMTWVVFWMARNARFLRARLESSLNQAVGIGRGAVFALSMVAVGREGLEIALFLWAGVTTADSTRAPLTGMGLGLITAILIGWAIYRGAVRIDLGAFFRWTGLFLIVLAAGMFAHGLHELQDAGMIQGSNAKAFDVSDQVPLSSWYGALLKGVFNFSPSPSILEAVAWLAYLVAVLIPFTRVVHRNHDATTRGSRGIPGKHPAHRDPVDAGRPVTKR